jgi:uncharacterized DUF497 family protein
MHFEWDEEKRLSNIAKHGFDFIRAARKALVRRSVSARTRAEDFKHWRTGRRDDRSGLDAARRKCLQDYFG